MKKTFRGGSKRRPTNKPKVSWNRNGGGRHRSDYTIPRGGISL